MGLHIKYQRWLVASYAYYHLDESLMSDEEYDATAKLLLDNWDGFRHTHKRIIKKADLEAGSAYALPKVRYPLIVRLAAVRQVERTKHENIP